MIEKFTKTTNLIIYSFLFKAVKIFLTAFFMGFKNEINNKQHFKNKVITGFYFTKNGAQNKS